MCFPAIGNEMAKLAMWRGRLKKEYLNYNNKGDA
jgi:hypothetical protein